MAHLDLYQSLAVYYVMFLTSSRLLDQSREGWEGKCASWHGLRYQWGPTFGVAAKVQPLVKNIDIVNRVVGGGGGVF